MPSEAPSRATAACPAAEPVWVAVDFDWSCGVRRRGARWRLRAGVFASPGSTFAGLFACLRGCLLAIVFVLWIRIRPSRCLHHHKPGARSQAGGDPEGAVDMDSNACRAREVERKVWRDNDSLLRSLLLKTPQLVVGRFRCVNPVKARGSRRVAGIGATELRSVRRRSSHCVLSRFAQGSSAWCNRGCIAQVPEQLTLNQRKVRVLPHPPSKSPKRPPL